MIVFHKYILLWFLSITAKLSNLQLYKLKTAKENATEVILKLSSNMIDNTNDKLVSDIQYY